MEVITSPSNPAIREIAALKTAKGREKSGLFVAEGQKLIFEAQKSGLTMVALLFDRESKNKEEYEKLALELQGKNVRVMAVSERVLRHVCDTVTPQGVAAVCRMLPEPLFRPGAKDICLVLDRIRDPGNLGAILRCAEAMGIDWVIAANCTDLYSPKTLRAAMGSAFRQKVWVYPSAASALRILKEKGFKLLAADLNEASLPIGRVDFSPPLAVVIGNEGSGIGGECLDLCDLSFIIPMSGETESLNAAVSAGIILWEIARKKGT